MSSTISSTIPTVAPEILPVLDPTTDPEVAEQLADDILLASAAAEKTQKVRGESHRSWAAPRSAESRAWTMGGSVD